MKYIGTVAVRVKPLLQPSQERFDYFWLETPEPLAQQKQSTAQTCTIFKISESEEEWAGAGIKSRNPNHSFKVF